MICSKLYGNFSFRGFVFAFVASPILTASCGQNSNVSRETTPSLAAAAPGASSANHISNESFELANGHATDNVSLPFVASMTVPVGIAGDIGAFNYCSATAIAPNVFLTQRSCLYYRDTLLTSGIKLRISGSEPVLNVSGGKAWLVISPNPDVDLALVRVDRNVAAVASIYRGANLVAGQRLTIVGNGATTPGGRFNKTWGLMSLEGFDASHILMNSSPRGQYPCGTGDVGGPLMSRNLLVGVLRGTALAAGEVRLTCNAGLHQSLYTRLAGHYGWIVRNTQLLQSR